MLSSQYKPLLSSSTEWASEFHGFAENVYIALDSLACGFEWNRKVSSCADELFLDSTNVRDVDTILEQLDKDPMFIQRIESILEEWCDGIEKYLSPVMSFSDASSTSSSIHGERGLVMDDLGPKGELEFWRNKMHRLNSVLEHFQSVKCKERIGILMEVSKVKGSRIFIKTRIPELINRWTNLDNMVTMSATCTKDNIKYLSSMQRFVGPFYNGNLKGMIDAIPALLNSVKVGLHCWAIFYIMIFLISQC
jgi:Dynein heavy chain, N-terminal region 1.